MFVAKIILITKKQRSKLEKQYEGADFTVECNNKQVRTQTRDSINRTSVWKYKMVLGCCKGLSGVPPEDMSTENLRI